jgi:hypothetical protein
VVRPTEAPTFFIDRCLGSQDVATALRAAGASVEVHDDHFARGALDVEWLPEVGERGWIVLTKDTRLRRHPQELRVLVAAGVGAFVLTAGNMRAADMAGAFTTALPRMLRVIATRTRPFVATVSESGTVTVVLRGERRGGVRK